MLRALFFILLASALAEASVYYHIPHYTLRQGWNSRLFLSNGSSQSQSVTLRAYSDQGLYLGFKTLQIPAWGFVSPDPKDLLAAAGVEQGWLTVEAQLAITGIFDFDNGSSSGGASHSPLALPTRALDLGLEAEGAGTVNGLVVCNPSDRPITVTLTLTGAEPSKTVQLELAPLSKFRGTPASLFGQAPSTPQRLQLRSEAHFTALGLIIGPNRLEALRSDLGTIGVADLVENLAQSVPTHWGRAFAVHMPGMETASVRLGQADLENALTLDHGMDLGTTGEALVAALFMKYQEEGLLDLDQNLVPYFPTLPRASRVTVRMLLEHTSGLANFRTAKAYSALWERARFTHQATTPERLLSLARTQGDDGYLETSREFPYESDTNYLLLGEIARMLTGRALAEELETRIFEPLGLARTYVAGAKEIPFRAFAFTNRDGLPVETTRHLDYSWYGTAGAIVTTPEDSLAFMHALFQGELLNPAALEEMVGSPALNTVRHGYGFLRFGLNDMTLTWATDRARHGSSAWYYLPEYDAGIAFQALESESNAELLTHLNNWLLNYVRNRLEP